MLLSAAPGRKHQWGAIGDGLRPLLHPVNGSLVVNWCVADDPLNTLRCSRTAGVGKKPGRQIITERVHACYVAKGRAVDKRCFVFGVGRFCACVRPLALLHRRDQSKDVASAAVAELVDAQR